MIMRASTLLLLAGLALFAAKGVAQTGVQPAPPSTTGQTAPAPAGAHTPEAPLPQLAAFMAQVRDRQRGAEAAERDYIYRESVREDDDDSHGNVKKTTTTDYEIFWINGVRVTRKLALNGNPLSPNEQKKENERIDKRVAEVKARRDKATSQGRDPEAHSGDEISFSRMVDLGDFTHEHREFIAGRPTIVVDYTGNPSSKTNNALEGIFHELSGTVWIDEQDKVIQHLEGEFSHPFKIGGGLVASVSQGTTFRFTAVKINNEVWLPASFEGHGHARALLLLSVTGGQSGRFFDYRKFKATSTISPAFSAVASS